MENRPPNGRRGACLNTKIGHYFCVVAGVPHGSQVSVYMSFIVQVTLSIRSTTQQTRWRKIVLEVGGGRPIMLHDLAEHETVMIHIDMRTPKPNAWVQHVSVTVLRRSNSNDKSSNSADSCPSQSQSTVLGHATPGHLIVVDSTPFPRTIKLEKVRKVLGTSNSKRRDTSPPVGGIENTTCH